MPRTNSIERNIHFHTLAPINVSSSLPRVLPGSKSKPRCFVEKENFPSRYDLSGLVQGGETIPGIKCAQRNIPNASNTV
jgi:hypothetical protein